MVGMIVRVLPLLAVGLACAQDRPARLMLEVASESYHVEFVKCGRTLVSKEFVSSSPVQLLRATSKVVGTGRWGICSWKVIPRRGKRCFISINETCWNKV